LLRETVVRSVVVIVRQILTNATSQVLRIERDQVIQDLTATTADPTFRHSVLARASEARSYRLDSATPQKLEDFVAEFRIPVENHVSIRARQREGLAQLLQDPVAGGMCTGVEMQDSASAMFDHEKAIQNVERQRRHREEVQCGNHLTMILQESEPVLRLAGATGAFIWRR